MDEKIVKQEIQKLVDKFEKIDKDGKSKKYNEEQTKKNYILPLFRALGWDVESDDVKAEEKVSKKRVDYAFKINGVPKFYLECKPFREDINDPKYAKQAIEYAWNKSVTWAILCNFKGIKVFNAEWKWDDKQPTRNRFLDLRYNEYNSSCFKYLIWLSRDNFEKGVLDEQATILGKKAKKLPISKQLLADFTEYRNLLSKDILRNNNKMNLSQEELDEIVQRILDRIIFIRTCEDKTIESEKLESLIRIHGKKEGKLYKELNKKFRDYDKGYNSKLFQEHLCENVIVSNDVLKHVIFGTYRSKKLDIRYDFSAINADILGNIYEQYLGHILKSTEKRAKLTNGKAHRKEQGIYYTPTYIVDYIVRSTLGEQLKKRGTKVDEIKILDPACGSGSFLIKAFDIMIEYVLKKESKSSTLQSRFEDIHSGSGGTLKRKTELLKNCIFGVDLDPQAVEITQLNLLLKLAEKRYRLPTLKENIKCGNSLNNEEREENLFNYKQDFKKIVMGGGFDVVIGNPPYIRQEELTSMKESLKSFEIYNGSNDIYAYFFEKGIKLLKNGGIFGFIVSSKFMKTKYGKELRTFILKNTKILKIIDFGDLPIFSDATTYPCIIILEKSWDSLKKNNRNKILVSKINDLDFTSLQEIIKKNNFKISQSSLSEKPWTFSKEEDISIKNKIEKIGVPLKQYIDEKLYRGITTGCNDAFIINEETKNNLIKKDEKSRSIIKPLLTGKDIKRYRTNFNKKYLIFTYTGIDIDKFPAIKNHLQNYRDKLDKVWEVKHGKHPWYELRGCSYYDKFSDEKIIYPRINIRPNFTLDLEGFFIQDSCFFIPSGSTYLLGILNSKLMEYYVKFVCSLLRGGYYDYRYQYVELFPIANPEKSSKDELSMQVKKMLNLQKQLIELNNKKTDEQLRIKDEIKKIDAKIDELVYTLYDLTKEEIKTIEDSLS
jgi:tRNA1(Val) A37 N6-methylase TrmN6